jgi:CheY-like chemotaxis protein
MMSPPTALIADDLKMFLAVARTFLEGRGIGVFTAENGAKALELARARHPRLILLDLVMPVMDGADACAEMRRDPALAFTPIIIMSATGSPEIRDRCLKAGCTCFVVKPGKPADLLTIIARILLARQRKPTRIPVVFSEADPVEGRQQVGKGGNMSGTGMLLMAGKPIRAGSLLNLEFVVPGTGNTVKVQARVARVDQDSQGIYGAGVHFLGLSETDQQHIVDYVSA